MLKRPHIFAAGLVVLLTLTFLNLPASTEVRLKHALGGAFLPLFGLTASSRQAAGKIGDTLATRSQLLQENQSLRDENRNLRMQVMQSAEALRENNRLRTLVGWQQKSPWKLKLSRVIARDPANWWRTVQIDLGTRDGMRSNLPVLTTDGLIGRVASVSFDRSQVILLGDPECRAAALVEGNARDFGIIGAAATLDPSLVNLSHLSKDAAIQPGQTVTTSGLGGVFPKGIRIGQIVDSRLVDYGLYTEARVKLSADPGTLEEVWVLFP